MLLPAVLAESCFAGSGILPECCSLIVTGKYRELSWYFLFLFFWGIIYESSAFRGGTYDRYSTGNTKH